MVCKKECIAMILAGGQGSRLYDLTSQTAKPAVTFGGKYKIIDFTLSNCINSGIDTVGVLTQYQPLALNEYIVNGAAWDLDRMRGGLSLLPPYQGINDNDWYRGTANAVYQNLNFINKYSPDYVLILSGDHIYNMDYSEMLKMHIKSEAVCTIGTLNVSLNDASRFGICNLNDNGYIYQFEEKPKQPKSTLASMGIYIFNTETLIEYLNADNADETSSNDFGKNIIPNLINNGESVYAYVFSGYWKDVGTIPSLWEANMDLLGEQPKFSLVSKNFRIYSKNKARPPHYIGSDAEIVNSLISEGCVIKASIKNSVLSGGVIVEEGAEIVDSVIMEDVKIESGAKVFSSIIDTGAIIHSGVIVGTPNARKESITVIPSGVDIYEDYTEVVK